jgi:hypothetical protein
LHNRVVLLGRIPISNGIDHVSTKSLNVHAQYALSRAVWRHDSVVNGHRASRRKKNYSVVTGVLMAEMAVVEHATAKIVAIVASEQMKPSDQVLVEPGSVFFALRPRFGRRFEQQ